MNAVSTHSQPPWWMLLPHEQQILSTYTPRHHNECCLHANDECCLHADQLNKLMLFLHSHHTLDLHEVSVHSHSFSVYSHHLYYSTFFFLFYITEHQWIIVVVPPRQGGLKWEVYRSEWLRLPSPPFIPGGGENEMLHMHLLLINSAFLLKPERCAHFLQLKPEKFCIHGNQLPFCYQITCVKEAQELG